MEIDITELFNTLEPRELSASVAEIGDHAGVFTWNMALRKSFEFQFMNDAKIKDAFTSFVGESGGWSEEEIAGWSDLELNALFLQWVAGDMREPVGFELGPDTTPEQWEDYQQMSEEGQVSGRIFKANDGKVYFSLY